MTRKRRGSRPHRTVFSMPLPVIRLLLVILMLGFCTGIVDTSMAAPRQQESQEHAEEEETLDPVHHSADAYYLDFSPAPKVELPRIFLIRSEDGGFGLQFFASSTSAVLNGHYIPHWETHEGSEMDPADVDPDEGETEAGADAEHATAPEGGYYEAVLEAPEGVQIVMDLSISRHLVFAWISMLIVAWLFISLARIYQRGPGRSSAPQGIFQNLLETLVVFVRDDIARPNLGPKTDKYLPYLLTAFFFILTSNLLGLVPFGATATSNLMVTAVLATCTFVVTQFAGSRDYWKHIFWPPGVPTLVKPILIPVEILGIFTKPFALAIRLFANMTAGHLVILSLIGLIFAFEDLFGPAAGYGVAPVSVAFALFIYLLELLVSLVQAYVFTMLSALFIGMAVAEHHHEHEEGHHGDVVPEVAA